MSIGGTAQKRHVSWRDEDSPLSSGSLNVGEAVDVD
jgi:hypothetical protein